MLDLQRNPTMSAIRLQRIYQFYQFIIREFPGENNLVNIFSNSELTKITVNKYSKAHL